MAHFGPRRADLEPAERLGGRQTGCATNRRTIVDARHALRAERALRAMPAFLLGRLELQQEQGCRQEPACASLATCGHRAACGGERRFRPAALYQIHDTEDLG